jgi:hypothetical protein
MRKFQALHHQQDQEVLPLQVLRERIIKTYSSPPTSGDSIGELLADLEQLTLIRHMFL